MEKNDSLFKKYDLCLKAGKTVLLKSKNPSDRQNYNEISTIFS